MFYRDLLGTELESISKGPVVVGNDVWVGERATVLSGVEIDDGAIIGAGSVVTRDVEPYAIVGGAPATRRGWRFEESIRQELLDLSWWEWSEEEIIRQREFFLTDLTTTDSVREVLD
jgi:virginiamycin A acetyltransferase